MKTIKLSDWCEKTGIKYLTAWRWFSSGRMPVYAYQTDTGTILVEDDEMNLNNVKSENFITDQNNTISMFLKKTVEFSKNNSTIEDFAAWILFTFFLKLKNSQELPKYSRNKPKSEDVQKHIQQFIKPKGEKPKPNMFMASEEVLEEIAKADGLTTEDASLRITEAVQNRSDIPVMVANTIPGLNEALLEIVNPTLSLFN